LSLYVMAVTWNLELLWVILLVAFGLGAVIFVHELGHFLVAKACGVKCEKFYIGFDIGGYKLWARKWGETEYGIGVLPLGGYVKMLGQDDNPTKIAEEAERSRIRKSDANSGNASTSSDEPSQEGRQPEITTGAVDKTMPDATEEFELDPRSYMAKSVPQRMAIISAGVVMNLIFAVVFATIAYSMGVDVQPAVVSDVEPASPAWRADVRPGDKIVQIGDRLNPRFRHLQSGIALGDLENGVRLKIERTGHDEPMTLTLLPEEGKGRVPTIGIRSPSTPTIDRVWPGSTASKAEPALQQGDEITAIDGEPVHGGEDLERMQVQHAAEPLTFTVQRKTSDKNGKRTQPQDASGVDETMEAFQTTIAPTPVRRLGLVMEMSPIVAVKSGSPAEQAGIQTGDRLLSIDGEPVGDPMTLPFRMASPAVERREVEITVLRPGKAGTEATEQTMTARLRPPRSSELTSGAVKDGAVSIPGLGISYRVLNRVREVDPDSPADKAGIQAGSRIVSASLLAGTAESTEEVKTLSSSKAIPLDKDDRNWPAVFNAVQLLVPGMEVSLKVMGGDKEREVKLAPVASQTLYYPDRGLVMEPLLHKLKADSFGQALVLGLEETKDSVLMVYRFLQKLGHQIPVTLLGGPLTIAQAAGMSAFHGVSSLLIFLTVLSANLAVINFLPIPLLDGGHMVFLAWEGIFGKPMSERLVIAFHMLGFALIIGLMLFVIGLDLGRLFGLT